MKDYEIPKGLRKELERNGGPMDVVWQCYHDSVRLDFSGGASQAGMLFRNPIGVEEKTPADTNLVEPMPVMPHQAYVAKWFSHSLLHVPADLLSVVRRKAVFTLQIGEKLYEGGTLDMLPLELPLERMIWPLVHIGVRYEFYNPPIIEIPVFFRFIIGGILFRPP